MKFGFQLVDFFKWVLHIYWAGWHVAMRGGGVGGVVGRGVGWRGRRPQAEAWTERFEEERGTFILKCKYVYSNFDLIIHRCYRR